MEEIRNFCIIAHIDHGKSTLADRFLEITGTVEKRKMREQVLDSNPIERERGITIKLAPVRMNYPAKRDPASRDENYQLNLIDTPGHADFAYEVERSLAACEGAILLVDATSGIQAQTLAHGLTAKNLGLKIIPVVNKIDLPNAEPEKTAEELTTIFGFKKEEICFVSAKTGEGVGKLLETIVERVESPRGSQEMPFRALIFNSFFDSHKGVIASVRVFDGKIRQGEDIYFLNSGAKTKAEGLGYFSPEMTSASEINCGEVGFIATGLKDLSLCQTGDTITSMEKGTIPLSGYRQPKPMVFVGFYPLDSRDHAKLREALGKLKLSDSGFSYVSESSLALGPGFRAGFLGPLHAEIARERLSREFEVEVLATLPQVSYQCRTKEKEFTINNPQQLPEIYEEIQEPILKMTIMVSQEWMGAAMTHCQNYRVEMVNIEYLGRNCRLIYKMPLAELVTDFYDKLKSVTSGFASVDYEMAGYQQAKVVRLDVLLNKKPVDAFSQLINAEKVEARGRKLVEKLKEAIPRQQFEVAIQAAIGSRIIAAERISALRKDVTEKLYGGDRSRKDKLLEAQKKGKKKMKQIGNVNLPPEAFLSALKY